MKTITNNIIKSPVFLPRSARAEANYRLCAKSRLLSIFTSKVLLAPGQAHSITYYSRLLSLNNGRTEWLWQTLHGPQSLKE